MLRGVVSRGELEQTTASASKGIESVFSITEREARANALSRQADVRPHSRIFRSIWFMKTLFQGFCRKLRHFRGGIVLLGKISTKFPGGSYLMREDPHESRTWIR